MPCAIWHRKGRGYYATIGGRQVMLAKEYEAAVRALEALVGAGPARSMGQDSPTLGAIFDEWLDHAARSSTADRLEKVRRYLGAEMAGTLRELRAADARPDDLEAWLATRSTWNATTRWAAGRAALAALNWAARARRIGTNPL